jgi:hypothetical protein
VDASLSGRDESKLTGRTARRKLDSYSVTTALVPYGAARHAATMSRITPTSING